MTTINSILASYRVEKQALKSCLGLIKLADQHSVDRVERACERALTYTSRPTLKSIQTILKTGQDKIPVATKEENTQKAVKSNPYGFTRGADYYGGKN